MRKVIIVFGMAYLAGCTPTDGTTGGVKYIAEPPSYNQKEDKKSPSAFKETTKILFSVSKKYCGSTKAFSRISKYCNFALNITK